MTGSVIKIIFIITLAIYVIVEITRNPYRKCENPKCNICPFPCNEEIKNEWSNNYDD